jgi:hypothetical protein
MPEYFDPRGQQNSQEAPRPAPSRRDPEGVGFCPAIAFQDASVHVPVRIRPFAEVEGITTQCLGEATVRSGDETPGEIGRRLRFVLSQRMRIEIPVVFGARTEVGQATIEDLNCHRGQWHGHSREDGENSGDIVVLFDDGEEEAAVTGGAGNDAAPGGKHTGRGHFSQGA